MKFYRALAHRLLLYLKISGSLYLNIERQCKRTSMPSTTLKHVEHFTNTIGPRGSATPEEKKAHEYAKRTLERLGYETHWEEFYAATSVWLPFALALGLMTLADLLFFLTGLTPNAQMGAVAAAARVLQPRVA